MNPLRFLTLKAMHWMACLASVIFLCGCHPLHQSVYFHAPLTSPPASLAALKRCDLTAAARILEPRVAANPRDAELSCTLGSVYLVQSDAVKDRQARRSLQARGWQLVEAASGRFYNADALLAHAYLRGRWGKKQNSKLYGKHLRLSMEVYKKMPHPTLEEQARKTWHTFPTP